MDLHSEESVTRIGLRKLEQEKRMQMEKLQVEYQVSLILRNLTSIGDEISF